MPPELLVGLATADDAAVYRLNDEQAIVASMKQPRAIANGADDPFIRHDYVSTIAYGSLSSATIGYWVSERFAGKGATPTAVALATDHCFFGVGLHRMEICIRPENEPSLRVVEKLGFRYEGLRRRYIHINGDWRDHFCFGLTVDELPQGVLRRWLDGKAPRDAAEVPAADRAKAARPLV